MSPRVWRFGEPVAPLAEILDRGGVLAVPTESSYGLAADPLSAEGIETIFRLKGRDAGKALPLVAADLEQIAALGADPEGPEMARLARVAGRIWPGPLTVVLPVRGHLSGAVDLPAAAPDGTVAVRIPAHEGLRGLLAALGRPLTATSANRAGEPPVLTPEAAARLLAGADAAVVDGGRLPGGPPSTVVRLVPGEVEVLREGAVPASEARRLLADC
ncbi:MAG TPA: L-threonylcarbamoyladenylate synthase [Thermoanaerobaculia bacterium]|nr:L-threonylcarbamoyladenylate synthase [Thermoanaerobaculia bacterium]